MALPSRSSLLALPLALAMLASPFAHARSVNSSAADVATARRVEPARFFGGQTVRLSLPLTPPEESLMLRSQLIQRAGVLASPVGSPLEAEIVLRGKWSPELDVPLPSVDRASDFELRMQVRRDNASDWRGAGQVALRVYPNDLLDPLRNWASAHTLRVVDDRGDLAAFLRRQDIAFRSRGDAPRAAKPPRITLYAGDAAERRATGSAGWPGAAVIFREREMGVPHLIVEGRDDQAVVTVEMQLLAQLDSDPLAQQTLVGIFELLELRSMGGDPK